jgi:uroporphyrinogen-III synthase
MSGGPGPLAGRGIVLTRPAGANEALAARLHAAGAVTLIHPAIALLEAPDPGALDALIDRLDDFNLAIFISPGAVDKGMGRIVARRGLPPAVQCAAVGPGGVAALARHGVHRVIAPEGVRVDSEALLALPALHNIAGRRVVIFRGDGGRELLGDTLRARGAEVSYAVCYRRVPAAIDAAALNATARAGGIAAAVFTSSEGLRHFAAAIGDEGRAWLCRTPVVVPHPRIAATARDAGCGEVITCGAGDDVLYGALLERLVAYPGSSIPTP